MTEKRYPRRRQAMLKEWRERELTKEASESAAPHPEERPQGASRRVADLP